MAAKSRNIHIELLRFLGALIVVMVHTNGLFPENYYRYPFCGGYLGVEFFLIISGFYAVSYSCMTETDKTPAIVAMNYVKKQACKMFPTVWVCVILNYFVVWVTGFLDTQDLPYMFYEMLLLPQSGIYKVFLNLPLWYLSAYFICLPVFIYLLRKSSDFFVNIGSILIALFIYGFICRKNIHLDIWSFYNGIWYVGIFRVFAGMCMGLISFRIYQSIRNNKNISNVYSKLYWFANLCLIAVVIFIFFVGYTYADYAIVLIMAVAIGIIMNNDIHYGQFEKYIRTLGKFSLYLYCSHWVIRFLIPIYLPNMSYFQWLPIYIIGCLIYAVFIYCICKFIKLIILKVKKVLL